MLVPVRSPLRISPCQIPRGSWQAEREAARASGWTDRPRSFRPPAAAGDLMWTSNYAPITDSIIARAARKKCEAGVRLVNKH